MSFQVHDILVEFSDLAFSLGLWHNYNTFYWLSRVDFCMGLLRMDQVLPVEPAMHRCLLVSLAGVEASFGFLRLCVLVVSKNWIYRVYRKNEIWAIFMFFDIFYFKIWPKSIFGAAFFSSKLFQRLIYSALNYYFPFSARSNATSANASSTTADATFSSPTSSTNKRRKNTDRNTAASGSIDATTKARTTTTCKSIYATSGIVELSTAWHDDAPPARRRPFSQAI